jgi:hypothetical protein
MGCINLCRRADICFIASRCYIQEAGTKSYQGDQGICNKVNGMQHQNQLDLLELAV